jgi:hypothetical protein
MTVANANPARQSPFDPMVRGLSLPINWNRQTATSSPPTKPSSSSLRALLPG